MLHRSRSRDPSGVADAVQDVLLIRKLFRPVKRTRMQEARDQRELKVAFGQLICCIATIPSVVEVAAESTERAYRRPLPTSSQG